MSAERDELFERWLNLPASDTRTIAELAADEAEPRPRIDTGFLKNSVGVLTRDEETRIRIGYLSTPPTDVIASLTPEHCAECGVGGQTLKAWHDAENARTVVLYTTCGHRTYIEPNDPRLNPFRSRR